MTESMVGIFDRPNSFLRKPLYFIIKGEQSSKLLNRDSFAVSISIIYSGKQAITESFFILWRMFVSAFQKIGLKT